MKRLGLFRRLGADQRGVSAVEFALIAPVMILFYFGLAEFCQAFMAQKRMGHVSATVADLVAQRGTITGAQIDDIFEVGGLIMRPFPTADLHQRVTSIQRDATGRMVVTWSRGHGMSALQAGDVLTDIPEGLLETAGETLVMTEVDYDYDSPSDYVLKSATQFSHRYYLRPRVVQSIVYTP